LSDFVERDDVQKWLFCLVVDSVVRTIEVMRSKIELRDTSLKLKKW
jgi:hypothetical protein